MYSQIDQQNLIDAGRFICDGHVKELLTKWSTFNYNHYLTEKVNGSKVKKCSFPRNLLPDVHGSRPTLVSNSLPELQRNQTKFILEKYGIHLHPGLRKFNLLHFTN